MSDWYEDNIEEGVRDVVKLLRDNGFNTECSCHHEMYVQCQYSPDGQIHRLHRLLFNNGFRNYEIAMTHTVTNGHSYDTMDINLTDRKKVERRDIGLDRESVVARLEEAIACAEEIKQAATWEWATKRSDQLIEAAKVLRGSIKYSDSEPENNGTDSATDHL